MKLTVNLVFESTVDGEGSAPAPVVAAILSPDAYEAIVGWAAQQLVPNTSGVGRGVQSMSRYATAPSDTDDQLVAAVVKEIVQNGLGNTLRMNPPASVQAAMAKFKEANDNLEIAHKAALGHPDSQGRGGKK